MVACAAEVYYLLCCRVNLLQTSAFRHEQVVTIEILQEERQRNQEVPLLDFFRG